MTAEQVSPELEQFYREIEDDSLQGLWRVVRGMARRTPVSPSRTSGPGGPCARTCSARPSW